MPQKLYLYLARRDKRGMRVIAVFNGHAATTRVSDVKALGLDVETTERLRGIAHENRMTHEFWLEPATDFIDLSSRLRDRGYTRLPLASAPLMDLRQGGILDASQLPSQKVMTKRKRP